MELILTFILIALGLAVLLAGIWTLLTKRAVMKGAKLHPAVFTGYELKEVGNKKSYTYGVYIPELRKNLTTVYGSYRKDKRKMPEHIEVYYNDRVERYCCIKGVYDAEWTFLTCLGVCVVLAMVGILLYM